MKLLFILCEGPHDAQFVGRLLLESGQYESWQEALRSYPEPLRGFFKAKFVSKNVDEIRIGKPGTPLVPLCACKRKDQDYLVFPLSMGGMAKSKEAIALIREIESSFSPDVCSTMGSAIDGYAILFIYDADSRGVDKTTGEFIEKVKGLYPELPATVNAEWIQVREHALSLFVFTDASGETGVLEDLLLALFEKNGEKCLTETVAHFSQHFESISENGDEIAHEAKRKKGILTTCGQMEKQNAGAALTVVLRDTKLLNGAFDFESGASQWKGLLDRINQPF